jgi:hypothetical protein
MSFEDVMKYYKCCDAKEVEIATPTSGTAFYVKCTFCPAHFKYITTRARAHLTKTKGMGVAVCPNVPDNVQSQLLQLEAKSRDAAGLSRSAAFDQATVATLVDRPVKLQKQQDLRAAFARMDKSAVDDLMAKCFYANGLSFNLARSTEFQASATPPNMPYNGENTTWCSFFGNADSMVGFRML